MLFRRSYGILLFVVLFGAVGLGDCSPPTTEVNKPFTLAYVDRDWQLRIRWSDDGMNWQSSSGGNPSIDRAPGIAANDAGVTYLAVFSDALSNAKFMMGIGPAAWDSTPHTVGNGHQGDIESGTSIVHLEGQKWLVAFLHQNQARVFEFDSSTGVRDFGAEVTPVSAVTNQNINDRPAMVNQNGKLLVSWLLTNKQVQLVTGNIVSGAPVWDAGYLFNTPEPGFLAPEAAHDLATDGQNFYLAVIRERVPESGQVLKRYFLFIYTSTDGQRWTKLTSQEVKKPESLSMAARDKDDIVAIVTAPAYNKALRFDGSGWSFLDNNAVFGSNVNNAGHNLTLYIKD